LMHVEKCSQIKPA